MLGSSNEAAVTWTLQENEQILAVVKKNINFDLEKLVVEDELDLMFLMNSSLLL